MLYSLLILLFTLSCFSCINDTPHEPDEPTTCWFERQPLPDFSVQMNDGRTLSPSALKGKVAVIVFFNSTCVDCQKFLPTLEAFYREQQAQSLPCTIVPIARAQDNKAVGAYWKKVGFTMPYSAQTDRKVYELFAKSGIPRVYIATPKGTAFHSFDDHHPPTLETLRQVVQSANRSSL